MAKRSVHAFHLLDMRAGAGMVGSCLRDLHRSLCATPADVLKYAYSSWKAQLPPFLVTSFILARQKQYWGFDCGCGTASHSVGPSCHSLPGYASRVPFCMMHSRPRAGNPGQKAVNLPSTGMKRTFKDKLHDRMQEAQENQIKAVHQQEMQDRKSLSVAMLVQGHPQAFVDFFMLSQPQLGSTAADETLPDHSLQGAATSDMPIQSMVFLQEQLIRANAETIAGQHQQAFDAYRVLARHFTQQGMLEKAVFFWKKCLKVSINAAWGAGELEARCALGLMYESLGQPQLAMACHEQCLQVAVGLQRHEDAATAQAQLVQVYAQQAEQCSRAGDLAAATNFYLKCHDAALQCGDAASAGAAAHHLGLIHQQKGQWQAAMEYQRSYMELARQAGDTAAEGRACVAYAECQQQLGQLAGAIQSLEAYLELSRSQDPRGSATACCKLGVLYHRQGKLEQAVGYFERFFELARSLGECTSIGMSMDQDAHCLWHSLLMHCALAINCA
eukprot:GHRR01024417.1.p1 GENE.GHRR01024417.1~~GHRR01024417.1.p1  ORF type:complete len:501 (+),score=169.42 GHRR01024417.1:22-1524(+)